MLDRLRPAARSIAPADAAEAMPLLRAALLDGAVASGAVAGEWLVGVALAAPGPPDGVDELAALGVAPEWRREGIATALLRAVVDRQDSRGRALVALHTAAERDPFDPLPREVRRSVAERIFRTVGMRSVGAIGASDSDAGAFAAFRAAAIGPQAALNRSASGSRPSDRGATPGANRAARPPSPLPIAIWQPAPRAPATDATRK
jgi:GNAT superfamily N-acetyltransferase